MEADVKLLTSKLKFRKECIKNFKIANIFLKKAAEAGLTLYEIANIMYKTDPDEESIL